MAINKNIQGFGRLDILDTGRQRRWSDDGKLRIVVESFSGQRLTLANQASNELRK